MSSNNRKTRRVLDCTNDVFRQSVCQALGLPSNTSVADLKDTYYHLRTAKMYLEPDNRDMAPFDVDATLRLKQLVDDIYQVKIRQLPTDILNDILTLHDTGLVRRQGITVGNILSELAHRTMLGYSGESDLKTGNGGVDGFAKKSARRGKKTPSKRNKPYKG